MAKETYPSKLAAAHEIYKIMSAAKQTRQQIVQRMMKILGMSEAGASTYYYKCKHAAEAAELELRVKQMAERVERERRQAEEAEKIRTAQREQAEQERAKAHADFMNNERIREILEEMMRNGAFGMGGNGFEFHWREAGPDPFNRTFKEQFKEREAPKAKPQPGKRHWTVVLGLQQPCGFADAKSAHRKLMMEHHPDRGGDVARAAEINNAFDEAKRVFGMA